MFPDIRRQIAGRKAAVILHLISLKAWPALTFGACFFLVLQTIAWAQTDVRRIYDLGTATTEGISHPLGVTLSALIKLKLLPAANIDVDAVNTLGSNSNTLRLRHGDLDFAIISNLDAYRSFHGVGPFAEQGTDEDLRILTNLWTSTFHFVVRTQFAPTGTFDDFLNLQGRRIALGGNGSALLDQARALFAGLDIEIDTAYALQNLDGRKAKEAFLQGEIDGFLLVDESQGAEIAAFLEEAGDQVTALAFSDDDIDAINDGGRSAWAQVSVPASTRSGETEERTVIAMHNLLGTSTRAPNDAVYEITKTIFDHLPFLEEMHSATIGIGLESALDRIVVPVHDGAAAYYSEVGITVPEPEPIRRSTLAQAPFLTRFGSIQEARARLNGGTFTILGGEAGQTITRMTGELAAMLEGDGIRVIGMTNPTPADNIADVLYARGVDSAVVPLDILDYALEQNVYPDMRTKLAYATELFPEEVHLVAADRFATLEDLVDQPVNLGPKGSASAFTASFLLDRLNIPIEPSYHDQRKALALLETGELAAAFFISGKPMPILHELQAGSGLRLLPLPALDGVAYRPATLSAVDYPALVAEGQSIPTFGVRSGLISYNWRPDNPRFEVLSNFLSALFDKLPALQEPGAGHHPKWREIDPSAEIEGWRRSPAGGRSPDL